MALAQFQQEKAEKNTDSGAAHIEERHEASQHRLRNNIDKEIINRRRDQQETDLKTDRKDDQEAQLPMIRLFGAAADPESEPGTPGQQQDTGGGQAHADEQIGFSASTG